MDLHYFVEDLVPAVFLDADPDLALQNCGPTFFNKNSSPTYS